MPIIKSDHRLEQVAFVFDGEGNVTDVVLQVEYLLKDDASGKEEARARKAASVWGSLSTGQKASVDSVGKSLNTLAKGL